MREKFGSLSNREFIYVIDEEFILDKSWINLRYFAILLLDKPQNVELDEPPEFCPHALGPTLMARGSFGAHRRRAPI